MAQPAGAGAPVVGAGQRRGRGGDDPIGDRGFGRKDAPAAAQKFGAIHQAAQPRYREPAKRIGHDRPARPGAVGVLREMPPPGARAGLPRKQPEHVAGDGGKPPPGARMRLDITAHAEHRIAGPGAGVAGAKHPPVGIQQQCAGVMIGGAPQHHPGNSLREMMLGGRDAVDAAIQDNRKIGTHGRLTRYQRIVKRRDLAVLGRTETGEPGLASMDNDTPHAGALHRVKKPWQGFVGVLIIDADPAFDGDLGLRTHPAWRAGSRQQAGVAASKPHQSSPTGPGRTGSRC